MSWAPLRWYSLPSVSGNFEPGARNSPEMIDGVSYPGFFRHVLLQVNAGVVIISYKINRTVRSLSVNVQFAVRGE